MTGDSAAAERLIRYLDDSLTDEERLQVEELLKKSPAARTLLRDISLQAVVIADSERVHRAARISDIQTAPRNRPALFRRPSGLIRAILAVGLAAGVGLAAFTASQFVTDSAANPTFITINALNGPLEWTSDGGRVTDRLSAGMQLSGGTIEMLAPHAWIEFQFADQSTVTVTGQSNVTISKRQQKELHLRRGRLNARVRPQPSGRPMLVHTPSAELKILGTRFHVEARPETTRLTVHEGQVRLKRVTDGRTVDVPAQQSVTASLGDEDRLPLSVGQPPVTVWQSDLRADVICGQWNSSLWKLGIKLKQAVASGKMTADAAHATYKKTASFDQDSGSIRATPSPFGALVLLSPQRSMEQPIRLNADTRIRVRGRLNSSATLRIGLSVYRTDGSFAGKYSVPLSAEELAAAANGLDIEIPISRFRKPDNPTDSAIGHDLFDWWCIADTSSASFEIFSVEVMDSHRPGP